LQQAAIAMANALQGRANDGSGKGAYRAKDQGIYKAFQSATGALKTDGYPGSGTMALLQQVLATTTTPMPNVPIYPWKAGPGWTHPNAPTQAEWNS
jgi:hypothetical protein